MCAVVALVAPAACSSGGSHGTSGRTTPTSASRHSGTKPPAHPPTTASTAATTGPFSIDAAATQALRVHLLDGIAGYTLQPAGRTATGPSSLGAAANDAGGGLGPSGAAERAALTGAGFRAGYKLLFSAGDRQILVLAYRFSSSAGAQRYATHAYTAHVHDGGAPSTRTPAAVPGARVVNRSEADASAALVLFTRGATLVILSTIQPAGTDAIAVVDPVATAQFDRLAGY